MSTNKLGYRDLTIDELKSIGGISNISINGGRVSTTDCDIMELPHVVIDGSGNVVSSSHTNAIILAEVRGDSALIFNQDGKCAVHPISELIAKVKDNIVNANIVDGKISFKSKTKRSGGLFKALMDTETCSVEIAGVTTRTYTKALGVPDNIVYSDYDLYLEGIVRDPSEFDPSRYSLEIVDIDGRKELRKFIGANYEGRVDIPDGVTHICKEAFMGATCTEVTMTDSVIYLGDRAFADSNVEVVKLSKNVIAIPLECFKSSRLMEINLENITSIDNLAFAKTLICKVNIEAPIKQVGFKAFQGCKYLRQFKHAGTLEKVRHDAFAGCVRLCDFDFSSVKAIEAHAFMDTGLRYVTISGDVGHLKGSTFTGAIEEITILDGLYKIDDFAAYSVKDQTKVTEEDEHNKKIVWTVPDSVTNIGNAAFRPIDTVVCSRKSVAAAAAILADASIIYTDELDKASIPTVIHKAKMLNMSIDDILRKSIEKMLSYLNEQGSCGEYEVDNTKVLRANITDPIFKLLPDKRFKSGKYATDEDIVNENAKFRCILEHLYRSSAICGFPFDKRVVSLASTFYVKGSYIDKFSKKRSRKNKETGLECLYNDGISSVYRVVYVDSKDETVTSSFLVAKTYDTLRYICMDNKYTDFLCESKYLTNIKSLLEVIRPGDTIGHSCVIQGIKYSNIDYLSNKQITVVINGEEQTQSLRMNLYQALRYGGITVRLDNNSFAIILPSERKVIKCAQLGKNTWQNEKEDSYLATQCTIESIEDLDNNTIFDYKSTVNSTNCGELINRFRKLGVNNYDEYKDGYSHIYEVSSSIYKDASIYAYKNNMDNINSIDLEFMLMLLQSSLFEERPESWIENSIGKTIIAAGEHEFELSDGSTIYQYTTAKKTRLSSKIMVGGDNKMYVFEVADSAGIVVGVYISKYDIRTLVNMCLSMNTVSKANTKMIFIDKTKFDTCEWNDVVEIAELYRGELIKLGRYISGKLILAVYKPNGLYYIGMKVYKYNLNSFIPLMMVGELDVALRLIALSNSLGAGNDSTSFLIRAGSGAIIKSPLYDASHSYVYSNTFDGEHAELLKARKLCIEGISDIDEYTKLDIPESLKRSLGYLVVGKNYYTTIDEEHIEDIEDIEIEMDDEDFGLDDIDLDLDDDDLGLDDDLDEYI